MLIVEIDALVRFRKAPLGLHSLVPSMPVATIISPTMAPRPRLAMIATVSAMMTTMSMTMVSVVSVPMVTVTMLAMSVTFLGYVDATLLAPGRHRRHEGHKGLLWAMRDA